VADPIAVTVVNATPWWRIVIDVAIAVGTVGATLVALFGQPFRAKFLPPKLTLRLHDALGEASRWRDEPPPGSAQAGQSGEVDARFYHLRVQNARRWSPARDARVVLLQVEEPGPDGTLQVRWTGDIPLSWRHDNVLPLFRVVGPDAYADLCSVISGKGFELRTLISPYILQTKRREPTTVVVTVQVQAAEKNSNTLRVRIAWDGSFDRGTQEMQRHLTVAEVD
jgi:hypothetical protein